MEPPTGEGELSPLISASILSQYSMLGEKVRALRASSLSEISGMMVFPTAIASSSPGMRGLSTAVSTIPSGSRSESSAFSGINPVSLRFKMLDADIAGWSDIVGVSL